MSKAELLFSSMINPSGALKRGKNKILEKNFKFFLFRIILFTYADKIICFFFVFLVFALLLAKLETLQQVSFYGCKAFFVFTFFPLFAPLFMQVVCLTIYERDDTRFRLYHQPFYKCTLTNYNVKTFFCFP